MKNFETPEINRFPLVIKDYITLSLDGNEGSDGIDMPEDPLS